MADSHDTHAPRSPFRIWQAFQWSMKGLRAAWQVESSFRLEVYLCILLVPLALYLGQTGIERFLLISVLLLVLIVEVLNSAIEAVVDRVSLDSNPLSKNAKDFGSAAVMLSLLLAIATWAVITLPLLL